MGEIDLSETKRGRGEFNRVVRNVRLERRHALPPRERFDAAREIGRVCHDPAGRDVVRIQLKNMTRDQHRAFMISALEEFLCLLREMLLAPRAIPAIAGEREQSEDKARSQTPPPAKEELAPRDRANTAKAIVTFGTLHCDEG